MTYIIRLAKEDDIEELSHLKQKVWIETYRGIYQDDMLDNFDYEKHKNKFLKIINDPDMFLYVVEDNNRLVGYIDFGKPHRPYKDYKQDISLLYLLRDYQKKGIGRELFNLAYNAIKEKGYKEFFISCNKYNDNARKFYEKMGGVLEDVDEDNEDKSIPQVKFRYEIK